ncbi:TolC family protein [Flavihumibacter profundi]|uniref:TolC family protein n=1 Tax=Flavihumibacter profundi TaxID=2716883 RepID=UPI001CC64242|nr:TolC family protein [Flavihumibacter profundi]MBZ5856958.1 TolC family protein [Flavihumibacter profundi]
MIPKIILFLLVVSFQSIAQTPLSLQQAIHKAWANRKIIQSGKSDLTIRKLQTEALFRKYWPQVSLEYVFQYNPILQTSILPIGQFNPSYPPDAYKNIQFGTPWSQAAGATVTQPLLDASIRRQINEYELQEKITAASQMQTEYDLAYNVAQAYININLQEQQIHSAVADTSRTWISYQLLKDKFDAKRLLKSDLNKALVNHGNAIQKFRDAISQLVENKVYLLFLMGDSNIKADIRTDILDLNRYQWQSENYKILNDSIPELQQLDYQARLTVLQQHSEKAKYQPTLSLKGYLGANQYTGAFNPVDGSSWFGYSYIGLDLKYPLLFGEDKHSKIQQLQLQALQFNQQREDKSAQYTKDAVTAKIKMDRVREQLRTLEENISLSRETIQIIQDRVAEGQESASTLNSEEADLQRVQAEYEFSKMQMGVYWLDYLKASGQLSRLWKN